MEDTQGSTINNGIYIKMNDETDMTLLDLQNNNALSFNLHLH